MPRNAARALSIVVAAYAGIAVAAQGGHVVVEANVRAASAAPALPTPAQWNPEHPVLFKGTVVGKQVSGPFADGKKYMTLLVKLSNGGIAMVELGPSSWIEAQGAEPKLRETLWVAGTKSWLSRSDTVIVAERVNIRGERFVMRRADGSPLWK